MSEFETVMWSTCD